VKRFIGALLVIACVAGAAGVVWHSGMRPQPFPGPEIDLAGLPEPVADALRRAEKRVRQSPHSAEAWGHWGMVFMAHELLTEATACLDRAEQLDPKSFRWPYYRGMCLIFDDPARALECFERAVSRNPDLPILRYELAERLLAAGRLDEAARQLHHTSLPAGDLRGELARGRLELLRGNLQESRRLTERVAAALPDKREAHDILSQVCLRLHDEAAAAEHSRRCRELGAQRAAWPDPLMDDVTALCRAPSQLLIQASVLSSQGEYSPAAALLRRVLQLSPDDSEALVLLGFVLMQQGDRAGAAQALDRAIAVSPQSAEARYYLGSLRMLEERWDQAAAALRSAVEIKPDYAAAHFALGECLRKTGDPADAVSEFRTALHVQPDHLACRLSLAELLLDRGERTEAREHLEAARRLSPDDARLKKLLARLDAE
jgi:tetratricopeptide (TPR) repeat protein